MFLGNYSYTATCPGYVAQSGTLDASTAGPHLLDVRFTAIPPTAVTNTSTPSPLTWAVAVGAGLFLIGVVGLVSTVYRYRNSEKRRGLAAVARIADTEWTRDPNGDPMPRTPR